MNDTFDPYHKWLGISPRDQPPDHYRLLGIDRFESDPDVIESAADQRMAHVRLLQAGKHSKLSQRILNEIAAAKICLLTPGKREAYDRQLHQVSSPPPGPPVAAARPLPVAARLEPVPSSPPQTHFDVPTYPRQGSSRGKAPAWPVLAAALGAAAGVGLIITLVFYLATTRGKDRETAVRPAPPPEKTTDRAGLPTPSFPSETVEPPVKPAGDPEGESEGNPVLPPPPSSSEREPAKEQETTPPAELPPESLPSEKPDPPEVVVPGEETVEVAWQRLREQFGRCETKDDFRKFVEEGFAISDRAVVAGDIDLAREIAAHALAAARKGEDTELVRQATLRVLKLQQP